jgi:hypothetical protein
VYALGPVHFDRRDYEKPPNEKEVRDYMRKWECVKRLPEGFQCWPVNNWTYRKGGKS